MKVFKILNLYKTMIYDNRLFILICFCIFTFSILLDSFMSSKQANISELQLTYNNLSLFRQGVLYIPLCTLITMKLLEFMDSTFLVIRLGKKNKIWNRAIVYILITNFIISIYLVSFSYISGLLFTQQRYMELNRTLILLISLVLLYTIGMSLLALIALIIKIITGNKIVSYMVLLSIIVREVLNQDYSLILLDISFNMEYLSDYKLAVLNIFKFSGITILLFGLGRMINEKGEIYNTKKLLMSENNYYD